MADDSFWDKIAASAVGAVTLLIATIWTMLNTRIGRIEAKADAALPKDDFHEYAARDQAAHDQLRQSIITLFDKVDEIKTILLEDKKR